jgi:hypothetical protein
MPSQDYTLIDPFMYANSKGQAHPNPYYTYSQVYTPRRLKDMFKWCEFLFYNSAHVYSTLRKFGEYPITEITYDTTNQVLKEKHQYLLEKVIHARDLLIEVTLDKYVYGNAFISMYQPFVRYLECPNCNTLTNIQNIDYKFKLKPFIFSFVCPGCKRTAAAGEEHIHDRKLMLSRRINFIRWDPKLMDIDHNPMTGESVYYYNVPVTVTSRVQEGHRTLIDTMPLGFLKAIRDKKQFKFAKNAVYHLKIGGPAGIEPQWGLPPLIAATQGFHHAAILKKANECISLEALMETPSGLILADNVNVGDLVRTNTGAWKPVIEKWYRDAREDEIGVKISIAGMRAFGQVYSPKHPILTLQHRDAIVERNNPEDKHYGGTKQPPGKILERAHLYEECCCPAGQIQIGDYALYPRKLPIEPQVIDVAKYSGLTTTGNYVYGQCSLETATAYEALEQGEEISYSLQGKTAKRMIKNGKCPPRFPAKLELTADLAYILGWYAGDGSCNKRSVFFSLGKDDDSSPLLIAIEKVFGIDPHENDNRDDNLNTVTICNVMIKGLIPGTARDKKAPIEILNAPDAIKIAYLKGLWDADGCFDLHRGTLATSSDNQAYDVYRLALHLGCIINLGTIETKAQVIREREIPGGRHHHVTVVGPSRDRLKTLFDGGIPEEVTTGKSGFIWKDSFAVRVCGVEEAEEEQYLDFKVAEDETFVVAGVCSHNSISLDYLTPFRILSPAQKSSQGDPVNMINLRDWQQKMTTNLKNWRKDPLQIMFSPIPVDKTQIGGDGRALLVTAEIQEAEKGIMAAMGIPMEFIYGGLTRSGMEATLRLIENQLQTHISDLLDLLQWVDDRCAKFLGWETIEVDMVPFKMIDDTTQKQFTANLYMQGLQSGQNVVSEHTMAELNDLDRDKEKKHIKQEALDRVREQHELQIEMEKLQNNLRNRTQAEAYQTQSVQYNQQALISQADQLVQQLASVDPATRQSQLHSLEVDDYVLWCIVSRRWADSQRQQGQQPQQQQG